MTTSVKIVINGNPQFSFFDDIDPSPKPLKDNTSNHEPKRCFNNPDPSTIRLGCVPLKRHLLRAGHNSPLIVAELLDGVDWSVLEGRYTNTGRPPYAPQKMMGLILYGIMQGKTSLRELEKLARLDLGAMWVSGGITPDHANIGRFIVLHDDSINGDFFESIARDALKKTGSGTESLAADGTTLEAACSHYNLMKEQAIKAAVEQARKEAEKAPKDKAKQEALTRALEVEGVLKERQDKRKAKSKDPKTVAVNPKELDAVVQKMKRGRGHAASYTPSVTANEKRIVTGYDVDPTSETKVVTKMLDQSEQLLGRKVDILMLDAGYCSNNIIDMAIDRDINLLCPEGKIAGKPKDTKKYQKAHFEYDELEDHYTCPAKEKLIPTAKVKDSPRSKGQTLYGGAPCKSCPLRIQCTSDKLGRRIRRYESDDARDALRKVMTHPKAQKAFGQRKAMVEPVFGHLRNIQGLNRFRRKGLKGVKREFALHLIAYNLSRVLSLFLWSVFVLLRVPFGYFLPQIKLFFRDVCHENTIATIKNVSQSWAYI